jgi:hypothetical protein
MKMSKSYNMKATSSFKNRILQMVFIFAIALMPLLGQGQDPNGVPDPGNGGGNPDAGSVPIDGGLSLLLAAGVGYGAKKLRSHNLKKKGEDQNI